MSMLRNFTDFDVRSGRPGGLAGRCTAGARAASSLQRPRKRLPSKRRTSKRRPRPQPLNRRLLHRRFSRPLRDPS